MGKGIQQLLLAIDDFLREAYNRFVVIEGYEPNSILVAVDHLTELANIQFTYYDHKRKWQEHFSGESNTLFLQVLGAAKELISDFEFHEEHVSYVFNKLDREAEMFFYKQDYKWLIEITFMYIPIEPENLFPLEYV